MEPSAHAYLGEDLEDLRSKEVLIEGECYDLMIVCLSDVVLYPGETLPLRIRNDRYLSTFAQSKINCLVSLVYALLSLRI